MRKKLTRYVLRITYDVTQSPPMDRPLRVALDPDPSGRPGGEAVRILMDLVIVHDPIVQFIYGDFRNPSR